MDLEKIEKTIKDLKEKLEKEKDENKKEILEKEIVEKEKEKIIFQTIKAIDDSKNYNNKITFILKDNNKSIRLTTGAIKEINAILSTCGGGIKENVKEYSYNSMPSVYNSLENLVKTFSDRFYIVNK